MADLAGVILRGISLLAYRPTKKTEIPKTLDKRLKGEYIRIIE